MDTHGYGGRILTKHVYVKTDVPGRPSREFTVTGRVEKWVNIHPKVVHLSGTVGKPIRATVRIVPLETCPFEILETSSKQGVFLRSELKEVQTAGPKGYSLAVEDVRNQPGRYRDVVTLIPSDNLPPIRISVFADIREERIALVNPPAADLTGRAGSMVKAVIKISPLEAEGFSITDVHAEKGHHIRCRIEEIKSPDGNHYLLTVENHRSEPGRYADAIILKTDHPTRPELRIDVNGDIYAQAASAPPEDSGPKTDFQEFIQQLKSSQDGKSSQPEPKRQYTEEEKRFLELLKRMTKGTE